jgi:hypothetical protein
MWLILWNLEWKLEMEDETVLIVERERERVLMETKREK